MFDIWKKCYFCVLKINRKMKRIIVYIIALVSLVSCLQGSSYSSTYQVIASFDYGNIKFADDSTYYGTPEALGLNWDFLLFSQKIDKDGSFLGGFRLSCLEGQIKEVKEEDQADPEVEASPLDMTWRVHNVPHRNNYMVFWHTPSAPESHIAFMNKAHGVCMVKACYVCNTAKVAAEVKEKFERGDKLTLKATGYLDKMVTGSAEIALADYTQNDKNGTPKDSIVSAWTTFDLSKLGSVDEVRFEMLSGNKEISKYFCMDDFLASISVEY